MGNPYARYWSKVFVFLITIKKVVIWNSKLFYIYCVSVRTLIVKNYYIDHSLFITSQEENYPIFFKNDDSPNDKVCSIYIKKLIGKCVQFILKVCILSNFRWMNMMSMTCCAALLSFICLSLFRKWKG